MTYSTQEKLVLGTSVENSVSVVTEANQNSLVSSELNDEQLKFKSFQINNVEVKIQRCLLTKIEIEEELSTVIADKNLNFALKVNENDIEIVFANNQVKAVNFNGQMVLRITKQDGDLENIVGNLSAKPGNVYASVISVDNFVDSIEDFPESTTSIDMYLKKDGDKELSHLDPSEYERDYFKVIK